MRGELFHFFFREDLLMFLVFLWEIFEFLLGFISDSCPFLGKGGFLDLEGPSWSPEFPAMFPNLFWGDFYLFCSTEFPFVPVNLGIKGS